MEKLRITVTGADADVVQLGRITTGMVGATATFRFDSVWDGLLKMAVFEAGRVKKDVPMTGNTVAIPPEVLTRPVALWVGVYGYLEDGTIVIPTVMVEAPERIRAGADPSGDTSTDPTLPVWAQILVMVGDLSQLTTEAKNSLVEAVNELAARSGGAADPAEIRKIVEEYLAANPPTVTEKDPTVPEWAKQPQKPKYTASEVGALPKDTKIPTVPEKVSAFENDAAYLTEDDLDGYAKEQWVKESYQTKGDYLTEVPDGYAKIEEIPKKTSELTNDSGFITKVPVDSVNGKTGAVNLTASDVGARPSTWIPTAQDVGAISQDDLQGATNNALAQAKASGEFDGKNGTSVTVASVTESEESGGTNAVKFSDGKSVNIKNGKDGVTPAFSIGTVETLDAGSKATASISGTAEKPVLNLGIPKGAPGEGGGSDFSQNVTLTTAQITALDNMFKVCAFIKDDVSAEYNAFQTAFGIVGSGGDVHSHSYTSSITTAATCTTAGVRTYTCNCGHSYTQTIPETGHNYVDGVCTVCGVADPTYTPGVTLTSISATYSGGEVPIGTAVPDLTGIVVTAHYSNGTTATVVGYTLSGTIAEGENTIAVTYEGQTATFVVVGANVLTSISAVYNGGSVTVGTAISDLTGIVVTAHYSDGTSEPVTAYTMTGAIAEGSNTITVGYGGKTTTFVVVGVSVPVNTQTEVLDTFKWKESGWPTATDNGDGSWAFDATGGQAVYDEIDNSGTKSYWTMIYPGDIAGGQLAIKFNKTVSEGTYVSVCVYAVNKDVTLAYQVTAKTAFAFTTAVGNPNVYNISENTTLDIPDELYPFIMVRKGTLKLEGDETSSNPIVANHIKDGDITFEVTGVV